MQHNRVTLAITRGFILVLVTLASFQQAKCAEPATQASVVKATFELVSYGGKFYVPVRINGQELGLFSVDTGSSNTSIYHEAAENLHLRTIARKKLDTLQGTKEQEVTVLTNVQVGSEQLNNVPAFICDCKNESLNTGDLIVGTIGMDFLGRQPFALDFRNQRLIFYDPAQFVPPSVESFPLRPNTATPIVRSFIEGREGWFEIDTGYFDAILLSRAFVEMNVDLVAHRPQMRGGVLWSANSDSYAVRWKFTDIVGRHFSDVFGLYDADGRLGNRTAGQLGASNFRECLLTIDMATCRAWREQLEPEPLDLLLLRLKDQAHRDLSNPSPLQQAAVMDRLDAIQSLLDSNESPDQADEQMGFTPLMVAAARNEAKAIGVLLAHGAKTGVRSKFHGYTAFLIAAIYGRLEVARQLIDAGVNINETMEADRTALFLAAEAGYADFVAFLLDHGAKIDQALSTGETPLLAACNNENSEVVGTLLAHHANPNAFGPRGTCLSYAAGAASVECVRLLLANGADPNRPAPNGQVPLLSAAASATPEGAECVKLLLAAGADPKVRTTSTPASPNGKSAFDIAVERGHMKSVQLLNGLTPTPSTQPATP